MDIEGYVLEKWEMCHGDFGGKYFVGDISNLSQEKLAVHIAY